MTMLRIGSMNLMLHGITIPSISTRTPYQEDYRSGDYDDILMNPPFKGSQQERSQRDVARQYHQVGIALCAPDMRALDMGGRSAVIVPDGVLFGSSRAHVELRKKLIEENRLDGVVSMPTGVFKPYAGVSTAVLFFTKGGRPSASGSTIWPTMVCPWMTNASPPAQNDIPDILDCWQHRHDPAFQANRQKR